MMASLSIRYRNLLPFLQDSKKAGGRKAADKDTRADMPPMYYNFWNSNRDLFFLDYLSGVLTLFNRWGKHRLDNWYKRENAKKKPENEYAEAVIDIVLQYLGKYQDRKYIEKYGPLIQDIQSQYARAVYWLCYTEGSSIPTKGEVTEVRRLADDLNKLAASIRKKADTMEQRLDLKKAALMNKQDIPDT